MLLHHLLHGKSVVSNEAHGGSGLWTKRNVLNAALRFVSYLYLGDIFLVVSNRALYTFQ